MENLEQKIDEISNKVVYAYNSCTLKTVNAFNPYQFEKMMDVLSKEYLHKGIDSDIFKSVVNRTLTSIGGFYIYK